MIDSYLSYNFCLNTWYNVTAVLSSSGLSSYVNGEFLNSNATAFGGYTTTEVANTEEYNGSAWTGGGNLATARTSLAGAGTQTSGLAFGGYTTTVLANTEEYNGSGWSAGGLSQHRRSDSHHSRRRRAESAVDEVVQTERHTG